MKALTSTDFHFDGQKSVYHGKVRDVYDINDDLMIMNRSGITIRMHVADLRVMGRNTQGVKLINLRGKDFIASITKVDAEPEAEVVAVDGTELPAEGESDTNTTDNVEKVETTDNENPTENKPTE